MIGKLHLTISTEHVQNSNNGNIGNKTQLLPCSKFYAMKFQLQTVDVVLIEMFQRPVSIATCLSSHLIYIRSR